MFLDGRFGRFSEDFYVEADGDGFEKFVGQHLTPISDEEYETAYNAAKAAINN